MGCRGAAAKGDLVRIVLSDGRYLLDRRQRAPGRGAYLHPGCGPRALRTRAVQRALRATGGSHDQLAALLAELGDDRSLGQI